MSLRVVLLAFLLLVAGCATETPGVPAEVPVADDAMPADFTGTVDYGNGSVPPPYHYEWRVRFDEATATVEWTPGYEEPEPWRHSVDIDDAKRERLYEMLREADAFTFDDNTDEGIVGGSTGSAELVADGKTYDTGSLGTSRAGQRVLDDVVAAVEELVPADVWAEMKDKQDEWAAQQPK